MYGDVWDKEKYLSWMYENLMAIKGVMSETASIYVHLDYHIGHYVKILMDEIFGEDNFRNEIIWKRATAHSDAEFYGNNFDCIYFYTKSSDNYIFNSVYTEYDSEYAARFKRIDEDGRRWDDRDLSAKGLQGGGYTYAYKGCTSLWRCPIETMQKLDEAGRLYFTKNGGIRRKLFSCVMLSVVPKQISMIFRIRTRVKYRARTAWTIFVPVFSRKLALPSSSSTRKSLCSRRRLTPCRSARLN